MSSPARISSPDEKAKGKENTNLFEEPLATMTIPTVPEKKDADASSTEDVACPGSGQGPKVKLRPPPLQLLERSAPIDIVKRGHKIQSLDPMDQYEFQSVVPSSPLTGRPPTGREGGCWPAEFAALHIDDEPGPDDYFSVRRLNQETFSEPALSESYTPSSPLSGLSMSSSKRSAGPQEAEPAPKVQRTMPPPAANVKGANAANNGGGAAVNDNGATPKVWDRAFLLQELELLRLDSAVLAWTSRVIKFGASLELIDAGVKLFASKMGQGGPNWFVLNVFDMYLDCVLNQMVEVKNNYHLCRARILFDEHERLAAQNKEMARLLQQQQEHIQSLLNCNQGM
ncbi:hypothetical protein TWF696_008605 [Orbilia brochopaga]|uniref:Uncharacterized protein n=1 Tax=Orbilia brochopaga TaxID=3140254 RepID=A0AAV9UGE9_9PEZI